MLQDIIFVKPLKNYKLYLRFEDNLEGIIDLQQQIKFTGVFEPLKNPDYFAQVKVNPELGTIQWPNGADLDPDVLYAALEIWTQLDWHFKRRSPTKLINPNLSSAIAKTLSLSPKNLAFL